MSYHYTTQRDNLFTDKGQRLFVAYRDLVRERLELAGAYMHGHLGLPKGIGIADGWDLLACDDRLVELGEIRELTGPDVAGQHRVFVKA